MVVATAAASVNMALLSGNIRSVRNVFMSYYNPLCLPSNAFLIMASVMTGRDDVSLADSFG